MIVTDRRVQGCTAALTHEQKYVKSTDFPNFTPKTTLKAKPLNGRIIKNRESGSPPTPEISLLACKRKWGVVCSLGTSFKMTSPVKIC